MFPKNMRDVLWDSAVSPKMHLPCVLAENVQKQGGWSSQCYSAVHGNNCTSLRFEEKSNTFSLPTSDHDNLPMKEGYGTYC